MADTLPEAGRKQHHHGVELVVALALSFAAIFALHRPMQVAVLRAETGFYQVIAHSSPAQQRIFLRNFWAQSSHGHYTPLAFTAEFFFAKQAGLRPNWWRNRQFFLAGLLTFFLFGFIRSAAEKTRAPPFAGALLAAAATLIFIAQPLMRDILQWPFHGLQVTWIIFALATGWGLVRLSDSTDKNRLLWLIALLAYGSMHVLGLGLAVVTGTFAVFCLILLPTLSGYFPEFRAHVTTLTRTLAFLAILGSAHTLAMITLNNASANTIATVAHSPDWHELVGLFALLPVSIFAELCGTRLDSRLIDSVLHTAWPIGVAVVLAIGLFIIVLFRGSQQVPCTRRSAALFLAMFSAVMLLTMVAMITLREIQEPTASGLYGYLIGARYVLPITVAWLGLALAAMMLLSAGRLFFAAAVSGLLALGTIVAHVSYESQVLPKLTPLHGASHIQVWRNLVQIAREARAANLPIPNLPLQSLSGFPFVDFKFLEPLLDDELHLPKNEHDSFLDWTECREHRLTEYLIKCPTLLPTAQLLDLKLPPSTTN